MISESIVSLAQSCARSACEPGAERVLFMSGFFARFIEEKDQDGSLGLAVYSEGVLPPLWGMGYDEACRQIEYAQSRRRSGAFEVDEFAAA